MDVFEIFEATMFLVFIGGFILIAINSQKSWNRLEKACRASGMQWHVPPQEELNLAAKKNVFLAQKIIWISIWRSIRLIGFYKSENEDVTRAIKRVRYSFLGLPLLWILMMMLTISFALITGTA